MATDTPRMPASYDENISREPEHQHSPCEEHGRCFVCEGCVPCATVAEQNAEAGRMLTDLPAHIASAELEIRKALRLLGELRGRLGDVELAEGDEGADAVHELGSALRSLRHVRRIVDWRVKLGEG